MFDLILCTQNMQPLYTCVCVSGFEGDHCETNSDECNSDPCENGGTCIVSMHECTLLINPCACVNG